MRTRSGSNYDLVDQPNQCPDDSLTPCAAPASDVTPPPAMEMDALEDAITSLDMVGPVTNEAIAQLLRGLATTIKKSVHATIARKDAEIRDLQIRLTNVEERCDDLEQYSRRNTVRIRGVAEAQNENTDCVVKELATRKLSIQISDSDVVRSHRIGKRAEDRSTPRDIIVRFTTHNTKSSVMRSARKLKGTHVFINEDLTKTRATIAWEARTLKRERKISDTWTRDGVIFVKKGETGIKSFTTQRAWKAFLDNQ